MPAERKLMRYGHSEGHTDVCFEDTGRYIVTCGSDGDVRIWEGLDDDDPKSINVGERAYSLALKDGKLVTALSNNTVQLHTFPEGDPDGILTRFTTSANHVTFNSNGSQIAAASGDFMIKIVEVSDSSHQKTLRGHQAPVLSVAFDPKDEFLASASCDGSVAVWNIEDQVQVISWNVLQKSNDVSNSKSLCRLSWQPISGKLLAVPVDRLVQLYERASWSLVSSLSDDFITQAVNVVAWSPCGKYLAAGSVGGFLTVWDVETEQCIEREKHERGYTVCGICWHPSGGQIAYTDTEGCLGLLDNVTDSSLFASKKDKVVAAKKESKYEDLFDEDDDGHFMDDLSVKPTSGTDDDDDDIMPSAARRQKSGTFDDDDDDDTPIDAALKMDKDVVGLPPAVPAVPQQIYEGPMPTRPQKPFQPGSTPTHLIHRFMVWNSVGIVRGYNDEQDNAIDVEFHDTSIHHAMHLTNSLGHILADLSREAVLLACEGTDELASKLQCLHFSSWDTNKEWIVDLPKDEDVQAVCLGQGWGAAATSARLIRIFSIGGVQKEIFSLPGPIVCMAGHGEQLFIVFHRGTGFDGDQSLGVQLFQLVQKRMQVICGEPLPLSCKSYLSWMGFTAEGTPCYVDSDGVLRMLNRCLGNTWTPVCNTQENCKGKSDHYWVVGVHEIPQQLRCIPCKGSRFPPTLPRPAVVILPFKLPLCQTATEKGSLEEQYWRSLLFHNHFDFQLSSGYEIDEEQRCKGQKEQQELLMKMFALSCKLEREFRCVELAELMTQNVVTLAIRYASRSHRMALAQRLGDLALEKTVAEQEDSEHTGYPGTWKKTRCNQSESECEEVQQLGSYREQEVMQEGCLEEQDEQEQMNIQEIGKPGLNLFNKDISHDTLSPKPSSKDGRVNPFKVSSSKAPATFVPSRMTNILDSMTASCKRSSSGVFSGGKAGKDAILKPLAPRPKSKTQTTLLKISGPKARKKEMEKESTEEEGHASQGASAQHSVNIKPKTGFQLWLEENRSSLLAENPDLEETDIIKEAMGHFRTLTAEDRLSWAERAKGQTGEVPDVKKRARVEDNDDFRNDKESNTKKKKTIDTSKLSAFAFNKN
uniref:WD repeat and HMG-box DNA-binding protein 1 n=1 Tax=Paramormyrops kingsleyae TaxID=1676925 RepID=A0A3B3RNP8_9TELE|nr:WD repeat and HMG-box DNA-binding protein 1 [Paramormyrops kingsleyae]XP_023695677.1 WD repeat and HMG-box DNA-binding protein 1 [Paramormyrops kingsleyae]